MCSLWIVIIIIVRNLFESVLEHPVKGLSFGRVATFLLIAGSNSEHRHAILGMYEDKEIGQCEIRRV
jgi:hypothetical protein